MGLCEAQWSLLTGDEAKRWRGGGADMGKGVLEPTSLKQLVHVISHLPGGRGSGVF